MRTLILFLAAICLASCQPDTSWQGSVEKLLHSQPDRFGTVMDDPRKFRVQIIYTQIDRDAENRPDFRSFTYRLDASEYFYPASTVKLPTAALALEKLRRLDRRGLDRNAIMQTGKSEAWQSEAIVDDTSRTGLPSVAHYIRKILLVSDNDAFNRLYEFLGQQALNDSLHDKGYASARIIHRLEIALSADQNRATNPVSFLHAGATVYQQGPQRSPHSYVGAQPERLGRAEIIDGELVQQPKDFAEKNAYSLQDLHDTVKAIMFPDSIDAGRRFDLADDDYGFLRRYMSEYPRESGIAAYSDPLIYPDGFVKFLLFGGDEADIPDNIRIFNKVGDAYGFLTDAAYIVDFENGVEFLLAATLYTNENQTFNDNEYEYDTIGLPFLRHLGESIYEVELQRERQHAPNIDHLRFPRSGELN